MLTADEILVRVQHRAGVMRRRRRIASGACAALLAAVLLGGAVAAAGGGDGSVSTADDPASTTTEAPTTTERPDDERSENERATSTTTTPETTTSTTAAPTTPPASGDDQTAGDDPEGGDPPEEDGSPSEGAPTGDASSPTVPAPTTDPGPTPTATVSGQRVYEGLIIDVVATYRTELRSPADRRVDLAIRIRDDHGSHPGGVVTWDKTLGREPPPETDFGTPKRGYECPSAVSENDPEAGPVDATFAVSLTYPSGGDMLLDVAAGTSWCWLDGTSHGVYLTVPVP